MRATLVLTLFVLGQCVLPQTLLLRGARADGASKQSSTQAPTKSETPVRASLNGVRIAAGPGAKGNSAGKAGSSAELRVPNNYTSMVPLDLSDDYVPTQTEVSGQGAMCGGLAPAAPAEPKDVEDEVDQKLRDEGFDEGLNTKLPTVEEAEALVARRAAPASLLAAVKRLEEGKTKVRKARKQNRDFALAMEKWNETDFDGADKALRIYVKEFSKKSEESPWLPEALIHIADLAKFNGQPNEAEDNYKKVIEMASSDASEMSYEAHLKAYERWADLYILEGRFGEARPMLEEIVADDVHWRRRTWAQYWVMQLNAYYAGAGTRLADLDCGTQALAALLVDLGRSREARRVAALDPTSEKGFSLAELKSIAGKEKLEVVGFRATPDALTTMALPALLHYAPSADARTENAKTAIPQSKALAYGHYVVVRAYDKERGLWSVLNPQDGTSATINAEQLSKEWSGVGLMLKNPPGQKANAIAMQGNRWLALWPNAKDNQAQPSVASTTNVRPQLVAATREQQKLTGLSLLSSDEMRRTVGTCYVIHANSQNGSRPFKVPIRPVCSVRGEPSVSIDPVDQNIFITDTPIWYEPAKGPQVEFSMAYNSLLASNYNGTVGNKWTHNYGSFLTEMPNQVTVFGGDGSQDVYTYQNGGYKPPNGVYNKLVKDLSRPYTYYVESQKGDREYYGIPPGQSSTVPVLLEQRDRWGKSLTIQYYLYGGQLVPWTLTDADGKITNFNYTSGRLTSIRVPDGKRCYFNYDGNGNLTSCVDVAGQGFTYRYDNMVVLTQLGTPQGLWKFVSEAQPYTGGNNGYNRIKVYDPMDPNQISPMVVNYDNRVHGVATYSYVDRRNKETFFGVNSTGGIGVVNRVTTPEGYTQTMTFSSTDPYQPITADGPLTSSTFNYNSYGNLLGSTSRMKANPNYYRSIGFTYNYGVDVTSITATAFQGDVASTQSLGTTSPDYFTHAPNSVTDPAGNRTAITYTDWGAPLTIQDPLYKTQFYYGTQPGFNLNRLVEIRRNTTLQAAFTYDGSGRVISMTDARGYTERYVYDALDNVTQTIYPDNTNESVAYDCCSLPQRVTDRSGKQTTYSYDSLKRMTSVTDASNNTLQFGYDREGNRTSLSDANFATTNWQYDGDGRVVTKIYANNTAERWAYNGTTGQLASSTNARNQTTQYSFGAWNDLNYVDHANSPDVRFLRDGFGRLKSMTDITGETQWNRDSAGRVTQELGALGTNIEYSYDALNRAYLTKVASNVGQDTVSFGYDAIGRPNQVTATTGKWGGVAGVRGNTWDMSYVGWSQMPLTETRPNGGYSEWNYESAGTLQRLAQVTNKISSASTVLSRFTYAYSPSTSSQGNRDNRVNLLKQYGNNTPQTTTFGYNATSMLTNESAVASNNPQTPQLYRSYGFDNMGNRTSYLDTINQQSVTSTYNNLNQITQSSLNQNTVTNYGYDNDGNMTSTSSTFYGVTGSPTVYGYDEENRLTSISALDATNQPNTKTEFVYDGMSRLRISRYYAKVNGTLTLQDEKRRIYDGMDVVQERDQYNNVTASYTRTGNIGGILARTTNAGSVFYGYDGAGNVTTLTDSAGAEVGSYTYDAWGNTVASSGAMASENPYRFSTKEQIGGLYSYGFRFYSPGLGRWINRDPIGEAGGTNLYGFVANSPVNSVDEYGLVPWWLTHKGWDDFITPPSNPCPGDDYSAAENLASTNQFAVRRGAQSWRVGAEVVLSAIPIPASRVVSGLGRTSSRSLAITGVGQKSQLHTKFLKHAQDFGVAGTPNAKNLAAFSRSLNTHINSPGTKTIVGSYLNNPVIHYVNPKTGLNVMTKYSGEFVSGWKLSSSQLTHVLTTGKLGGHP